MIGSLNGRTPESWLKFARVIEQAGADALELNMYEVPADLSVPGTAIEDRLAAVVKDLKRLLKIPVAVKLLPFFTAFGNVAHRLDPAGADGLVLFNRFYQPDIDIRSMTVDPQAELSTSADLRLRLRWAAILHGRIRPSIAISGGVVEPDDGIKALLAGADVVQMVSGLLRHGPTHVEIDASGSRAVDDVARHEPAGRSRADRSACRRPMTAARSSGRSTSGPCIAGLHNAARSRLRTRYARRLSRADRDLPDRSVVCHRLRREPSAANLARPLAVPLTIILWMGALTSFWLGVRGRFNRRGRSQDSW